MDRGLGEVRVPPIREDDPESPKSALHAGDFTQQSSALSGRRGRAQESSQVDPFETSDRPLGSSPTTPWSKSTVKSIPAYYGDTNTPLSVDTPHSPNLRPVRSRTPSIHSFSSSYVLKTPTSPLVQESSNDDLDMSAFDLSSSQSKENRRHTLPPQAFRALKSSPLGSFHTLAQAARQPPTLQRESSVPWRSHQSRRSLTAAWPAYPASSPQTPPFLRSRRPSLASDASPIQHASMVGSYEESILRGRMSTTPSKPLDFTAQIGALGKGGCKPKYPAHVTVDFPAVYYSWNAGVGRSTSVEDEPSPYVGYIDLEHQLPEASTKEKRRRKPDVDLAEDHGSMSESMKKLSNPRKRGKRKHRSPSPRPRTPTGGSYRIPQQGQLQILIKNPNKTAVKLFLVPFDLEGMEPGTKTFIRQRCYSAGPITETPPTSSRSSPDQPSLSPTPAKPDPKDKPTLRYLIQLNICCPSKSRFYLYRSIHVVFANRVPDNMAKIRNEILLPEPRYSPYKPSVEHGTSPSSRAQQARRFSESAPRRRSYTGQSDVDTEPCPQTTGTVAPAMVAVGVRYPHGTIFPPGVGVEAEAAPPVPPIPFVFASSRRRTDDGLATPALADLADSNVGARAQAASQAARDLFVPRRTVSSSSGTGSSSGSDVYNKLARGEAGYGGLFGRPGTPEPGEGLLARRLRGLEVEVASGGDDGKMDWEQRDEDEMPGTGDRLDE